MRAEVRLHSEGCRESIKQAMVDETWAAKSQSERSLKFCPSVGCSNHETERGSSHTRECDRCDVAGSNGEHQGPRVDQEERMMRTRNCTPRTWPERDARKAKKEAVKNVAESMHECDQHEGVPRSEQ